jgi:hypothetical protein
VWGYSFPIGTIKTHWLPFWLTRQHKKGEQQQHRDSKRTEQNVVQNQMKSPSKEESTRSPRYQGKVKHSIRNPAKSLPSGSHRCDPYKREKRRQVILTLGSTALLDSASSQWVSDVVKMAQNEFLRRTLKKLPKA